MNNQMSKKIAINKGLIIRCINKIRLWIADDGEIGELERLQLKLEETREVYVDEVYNYMEVLIQNDEKEMTRQKEDDLRNEENRINEVNKLIHS